MQSYTLLVGNFGGRIAMPTNSSYCLVYANTYSSTVPLPEQTPFNTVGSPPGLCLGKCMCRTLLQVADLSMERKWQYAGSHLIIPHSTQFTHRLPTILYPGDSLLFDSAELIRLWQKNYSILMHMPPVSHTGHLSTIAFGGASSHSTFKSDAEAQSQGVTPPVTPPCHPQLQGWQEVASAPLSQGGKLSLRRKMRPSKRTMPHAKTLTAPPPRSPMVVKVGSTAQARMVLHLP